MFYAHISSLKSAPVKHVTNAEVPRVVQPSEATVVKTDQPIAKVAGTT